MRQLTRYAGLSEYVVVLFGLQSLSVAMRQFVSLLLGSLVFLRSMPGAREPFFNQGRSQKFVLRGYKSFYFFWGGYKTVEYPF